MTKIVVTKPGEYLKPRKPCTACKGEGKVPSEPVTVLETESDQLVTLVLRDTCGLCKGRGWLGPEVRA